MDRDRPALNRLPGWFVPAAAALPVAVLAAFYAWPLVTLLATVLDGGSVRRTLRLPGIAEVMWFTLWQAVASTAATLLVGLAPAYVLARFRFPGRRALLAIVTVPFMLPTVVVGAAFLALLPRSMHGTATAVIVAHVFFNVAVIVRVVGGMWSVLPRDLTGAARTLGANRVQVLRHVVLPLLRPGIVAAGAVVFLFTFTSFGVVKLLGGAANPTLEVEIARRATQLGDVDGAAVLALVQLAVLAAVVALAARWQRTTATALRGDATASPPRGRAERWTVAGVGAATAVLMLAPAVVLSLRSVRVRGSWTLAAWRNLAGSEVRPGLSLGVDPLASLGVSVRFAALAAALSTVVGVLAAVAVAAARRHGRLLDVGVMLPLGTSAVTIGLGMLITFDVAPVDWRAKWWLVPVGHSLVAIPFVVRAVLPVLRAVPVDLRAAAATLGASPLRAWWWVDGRALRRPLLTGAAFAAAISLGEFGATTFLTRSGRETVPIAIGRLLGRAGDLPRAQAFALATMLLVVTAAIIATIDALGSDGAVTPVGGGPMLDVREVTVRFDATAVLDCVSLHVADGEVVGLLGPSGSGKSTLLRVIAGLLVPDAGSVWLDGRDVSHVPTHRRGVGMVFQDEQLFPHLDVAGNIGFGLRMAGSGRRDTAARVGELLDLVGLPGFGGRRVDRLSGGEAKRVALARSLAPHPRALLLDEPLTGLDRDLHDELAGVLARLLRSTATTALLVTHDPDEADTIADRVVRVGEL